MDYGMPKDARSARRSQAAFEEHMRNHTYNSPSSSDPISKILFNISRGWSVEGIVNCLKVHDVDVYALLRFVNDGVRKIKTCAADNPVKFSRIEAVQLIEWILDHGVFTKEEKRIIAASYYGRKFSCYDELLKGWML